MYKPNGRWADTAAGLVKTAKLKGKLKADASPSMLSLSNASEEIAKALRIRQDAASAALYGLCAIGRVRWVDYDGKLVDCDEVTVSNFWWEARLCGCRGCPRRGRRVVQSEPLKAEANEE